MEIHEFLFFPEFIQESKLTNLAKLKKHVMHLKLLFFWLKSSNCMKEKPRRITVIFWKDIKIPSQKCVAESSTNICKCQCLTKYSVN